MRRIVLGLAGFLMLGLSVSAHGEERHGIQIYKGAKLDTVETNFAREIAGADAYCYRTGGSVKKVSAFYRKQPGLMSLGGDATGERFVKEENGYTVYVLIANPWSAAKTGQLNEDTIIRIMRE